MAENAERASGKLRDEELPRLRADLARLDVIESNLSKRDAILRKLGEQPEWFNYFAALVPRSSRPRSCTPSTRSRRADKRRRPPPPATAARRGPRRPRSPPSASSRAGGAAVGDIEPCILSQECELPPSPFDELAPPPPTPTILPPPAARRTRRRPPGLRRRRPAHAAAEPAAAVATAAPAAVGGAFSLLEERASRLGAAAADADTSAAAAAAASAAAAAAAAATAAARAEMQAAAACGGRAGGGGRIGGREGQLSLPVGLTSLEELSSLYQGLPALLGGAPSASTECMRR